MNLFSPLSWFLLALAVALLALLAFLVMRRRRAAKSPGVVGPVPGISMPADALERVWVGFSRQIPWIERRQALGYPLSLVIGNNGSGKTTLIDRHGNWRGQQYRFHPSSIDDPLLQVYLGPRHLLLELAAAVLRNTSPNGHRALRRLWQRLPSAPTIILAVNAKDLLPPDPEQLRETADTLFGKIAVFSAWEGRPLPVTVAVTHMDAVEGFSEFGGFLEQIGVPLEVDLKAGWPERFNDALKPFQVHLARALLERPADQYLRMLTFFDKSQNLLDTLWEFLRYGRESQGTTGFTLRRICFLSDQLSAPVTSPFNAPPTQAKPPRRPLSRDFKIAVGISIVGLAYLIGSYEHQRDLIIKTKNKAHKIINSINNQAQLNPENPADIFSIKNYDGQVHPLFHDFSLDPRRDLMLTFMPSFFERWQNENNNSLIKQIRQQVLLHSMTNSKIMPGLSDLQADYVLALLFATKDNPLGNTIEEHTTEWATALDISPSLIGDYIYFNRGTDALDLNYLFTIFNDRANKTCRAPGTGTGNIVSTKDGILRLFTKLQTDIRNGTASREIVQIKKQAEVLLGALAELRYSRAKKYIHHQNISGLLEKKLSSDDKFKDLQGCRSGLRKEFDEVLAEDIKKQLRKVETLSIDRDTASTSRLSLWACLELLEAESKPDKSAASGDTIASGDTAASGEFQFLGETFSPDYKRLNDGIKRDTLTASIRACTKSHSRQEGLALFKSGTGLESLPPVVVRATPGIDRQFLRAEFEYYVRPVVERWTTLVNTWATDKKSPPSPSKADIDQFTQLLKDNIKAYAKKYAQAYFDFFKTLTPKIGSQAGLMDALQQTQEPASTFVSGLVAIRANTQFDPWSNDEATTYLEILKHELQHFLSLNSAMVGENGAFPEFGKYQKILLKMQHDLESDEPKPPKPGTVAAGLLASMNPLGKIALDTMIAEDASYLGKVNEWLEGNLLNDPWSVPFLAPVEKARAMGTPYVVADIKAAWFENWHAHIKPLLSRFPFDQNAGPNAEVSPDDIIKALHPKDGLFWQQFQQSFGGLLLLSDGTWKLRPDLEKYHLFPDGMLEKLNLVQRVSNLLWNEKGEPKPLVLMIRAETLPNVYSKDPVPVVSLAFIRSGEFSVMGFNQQPHWQKFDLAWWASKPSSIGLKFQDAEASARPYADITVTDSAWNFYRLLAKGKATAEKSGVAKNALRYQWTIPHPKLPRQMVKLTFSFQDNPWMPFSTFGEAAK